MNAPHNKNVATATINGPLEFRGTILDRLYNLFGMERMRTPAKISDITSELIPERIKGWRNRIRNFFTGNKAEK